MSADLTCEACDGEGRVMVEVIHHGDQAYPDVEICRVCNGTGEG